MARLATHGYQARSLLESEQEVLLRQMKWFIAPYLQAMKLSEEQIDYQDLDDLQVSLKTIEQAISNSEGWPRFGVKIDSKAGLILTKASAENHFQVTALPILLEHKRFILERIKHLSNQEKIGALRGLIKNVDDEDIREKIGKEVDDLALENRRSEEQILEIKEVQHETQLDFQNRINELNLFKEKSKVYLSFLDREPAATVLGAILLIVFGISLIVFVFIRTPIPDIISGTFFTILGYFFGQSSSRQDR